MLTSYFSAFHYRSLQLTWPQSKSEVKPQGSQCLFSTLTSLVPWLDPDETVQETVCGWYSKVSFPYFEYSTMEDLFAYLLWFPHNQDDMAAHQLIVVPVFKSCHWTIMKINVAAHTLTYCDSYHKNYEEGLDALQTYLEKKWGLTGWSKHYASVSISHLHCKLDLFSIASH